MRPSGPVVLLLVVGAGATGVLLPGLLLPAEEISPFVPHGQPRMVELVDGMLRVDGQPHPLLRCVGFQPLPVGVRPETHSWMADPAGYEPDLRMLAEAGANTLLVYSRWAATPDDLEAFLDRAWSLRFSVILAVDGPNGKDAAGEEERAAFFSRVETAAAHRQHPALLLWMLGNEVDYRYGGEDLQDWFNLFNEGANWLRKVDGHHPILYAANPGTPAERVAGSVQADVHGVNFYGLTEGMMARYLPALHNRTGRPVMLVEYGADAWDTNASQEAAEVQASVLADVWRGVALGRARGYPVLGGCLHEWSDQWWKNGDPNSHDPTPAWKAPKVGVLPDDLLSDEWFGLAAVLPGVAGRHPRPALQALGEAWRAEVTAAGIPPPQG